MTRYDEYDDYYDGPTRAECEAEEAEAEFQRWCEEEGEDPDDENAREAFFDGMSYAADPMRYYGLRQSDFM